MSDTQVEELVALGVSARAITVIPNGTDFVAARDRRDIARRELGLRITDVAALLVGRLESQKRVDLFVDALAIAQRQDPRVVGLIAGSGPDADALAAHARSRAARVQFLGRRDDMPTILAAVDVLCITSDVEAAPYAVLEGMASGLPVVATRVGSLPDWVVEDETGVLVDSGAAAPIANALLKLASDPAGRYRMGRAGKSRQLALFSADMMVGAYVEALVRLAGRTVP